MTPADRRQAEEGRLLCEWRQRIAWIVLRADAPAALELLRELHDRADAVTLTFTALRSDALPSEQGGPAAPASVDWNRIQANFACRCAGCSKSIAEGGTIWWCRGERARCVGCGPVAA